MTQISNIVIIGNGFVWVLCAEQTSIFLLGQLLLLSILFIFFYIYILFIVDHTIFLFGAIEVKTFCCHCVAKTANNNSNSSGRSTNSHSSSKRKRNRNKKKKTF